MVIRKSRYTPSHSEPPGAMRPYPRNPRVPTPVAPARGEGRAVTPVRRSPGAGTGKTSTTPAVPAKRIRKPIVRPRTR